MLKMFNLRGVGFIYPLDVAAKCGEDCGNGLRVPNRISCRGWSSRGILIFLFSGVLAITVRGQQGGFTFRGLQGTVDVFRTDGRPWSNPVSDIEGSPFYSDEWKLADVVLSSDKEVGHIQVRLNLESQEMHFLGAGNTEMAVSGGVVRAFIFLDPSRGNDSIVGTFSCGYPVIDRHSNNAFYEIMVPGKLQLLHYREKKVSTEKHEMTGDVSKRYVLYDDYYVYDGKEMKRLKKDQSFIDGLLGDKVKVVAAFISENRLKYKTMEDIQKILVYYNGLN